MKKEDIKEKEKKYWNVALSKNTYSELLKRGEKGESFDHVVSKLLNKKGQPESGLQAPRADLN